ncbi:MAG: hypothetical protein ACLFVU_11885 [Phycisphaerae bacterium]
MPRASFLLTAMMSVLVSTVACSNEEPQRPEAPAEKPEPGEPIVRVPVFHHGTGRGKQTKPPNFLFLSTEQARGIILDELNRDGRKHNPTLSLSAEAAEMPELYTYGTRPAIKRIDKAVRRYHEPNYSDKRTYRPDLYDPERALAIKFVSKDEYADLGGVMVGAAEETFDIVELAGRLSEQARCGDREITVVHFYDPVVKIHWSYGSTYQHSLDRRVEHVRKGAQRAAEQQLRKQVKDFLRWYQKQKADGDAKNASARQSSSKA